MKGVNMYRVIMLLFLAVTAGFISPAAAKAGDAATRQNIVACWPADRSKCRPVPMGDVHINGFLGERIDLNLTSVLAGLESPIPRGFEARAKGKELPPEANRLAADSDLYKWLEGACYVYARTKDSKLRAEIDRIAGYILMCQKSDGYINTQVPPNQRFDPRINHDLYIAGHFFEAAVAHHRATGCEDLLHAACRWADYLISEYKKGNQYYANTREHPEYELGFLRLGREAGRPEYVDFAATLVFKLSTVGSKVSDVRGGSYRHAVRIGYLLAGMADLYLETGRHDMIEHLPGLWRELVDTRMYLTGAIGSNGEYISAMPFDLPLAPGGYSNHKHFGETCACVSMIMFSWRMHAITGRSECFDVIEQALYNQYLGAFSLDNLANFYYNPIQVTGDLAGKTDHGHSPMCTRCRLPEIHSTACCMPNGWRFFGALPEYVFSYDADGLFVNLYTSATVDHMLTDGRQIKLAVETDYPNSGNVTIRFDGKQPTRFKLRLRIPGWSSNAKIEFGGNMTEIVEGGDYFVVDQIWKPEETARLRIPMPARMIVPDPRIKAQSGLVAFARGPLVYCLEKPDVNFPVERAKVALKSEEVPARVHAEWRGDLLGGIHVLHVPGLVNDKPVDLPLIPWYTRANRSNNSRWVAMIPTTVIHPSVYYRADNVDGEGNPGDSSTTMLVNLVNPGTHDGTLTANNSPKGWTTLTPKFGVGSVQGVTQNAGQAGTPYEYGVVMDGSHIRADSFKLAGGVNKATSATWEFWLYVDDCPGFVGNLYMEHNSASSVSARHDIQIDNLGDVYYDEYPSTASTYGPAAGTYTQDQFMQLVVVKDGDAVRVYNNGSLVSTGTNSETYTGGDTDQTFFGDRGQGTDETIRPWDGQFNIIRVYDTALTDEEVLLNYKNIISEIKMN